MKEDKIYKLDVIQAYLRHCRTVAREELKQLETRRSQVSITPSDYLGIYPRVPRNRNQLLRVKMFLDYVETQKLDLDEETRTYILLLKDEYLKKIKKVRFKDPYSFIIQVPLSQWLRYKSSYFPKPRILPQLAQDARAWKFWSLPRAPKEQKIQRSQIRGYRDKGSTVSEDVKAARAAALAAAQRKQDEQLSKQALSLARRMRIQPTTEDVIRAVRIILGK